MSSVEAPVICEGSGYLSVGDMNFALYYLALAILAQNNGHSWLSSF